MIASVSGFDRLAARLTLAAERIAQANAQFRAERSASDPASLDPASRWHRAALLWPLFTKGQPPFTQG